MPELRRAVQADLDAIARIEKEAFQPWRRSSRDSLRRSLQSPHQSVWVFDDGAIGGAIVLWHHERTVRVYGIAVDPARQGQGIGRRLMDHAEGLARETGKERVVLEADADDERLLAWYEGNGYRRDHRLDDFYAPGHAAWRLEKVIAGRSGQAAPGPSGQTVGAPSGPRA